MKFITALFIGTATVTYALPQAEKPSTPAIQACGETNTVCLDNYMKCETQFPGKDEQIQECLRDANQKKTTEAQDKDQEKAAKQKEAQRLHAQAKQRCDKLAAKDICNGALLGCEDYQFARRLTYGGCLDGTVNYWEAKEKNSSKEPERI